MNDELLSRPVRIALMMLLLLELQLNIVDGIRIAGRQPLILLLIPIGAALEGDGSRAAVAGFVAGLVLDLFLETPLGLSASVFAMIGYGVASFERGVIRADKWLQPAVAGVASGLGVIGLAAVAALFGRPEYFRVSLLASVAVVSITNVIIATPTVRLVRWALGPVTARGAMHV